MKKPLQTHQFCTFLFYTLVFFCLVSGVARLQESWPYLDLSQHMAAKPWDHQKITVTLQDIHGQPMDDTVPHVLKIIDQQYVDQDRIIPWVFLEEGLKSLQLAHPTAIQWQNAENFAIPYESSVPSPSLTLCLEKQVFRYTFCNHDNKKHIDFSKNLLVRVGLRVFYDGHFESHTDEPISLWALEAWANAIIEEISYVTGTAFQQNAYVFINGFLSKLDPHSAFLSPEEYSHLKGGTRGIFGGVGLILDQIYDVAIVRETVINSPAHKAGIEAGDMILKIGEKRVLFQPLEQVLQELKKVRSLSNMPLWLYRPSAHTIFKVNIFRGNASVLSAEAKNIIGRPDVLHIKVNNFSTHTAQDVRDLYTQAAAQRPLTYMVLDLRGNPGGLLEQAIQLSDLFLDQGKIVSIKTRHEDQDSYAVSGMPINLPLVVLINSSSASASEIVAAALQERKRALIVGERSYGKGSVQSLFECHDGFALKLTIAHYFTPLGNSLQNQGVQPDISIKLIQEKDGFLWMPGSSEGEREQDLMSHLAHPLLTIPPSHKSTDQWVYDTNQFDVQPFSNIIFTYPLFESSDKPLDVERDGFLNVALKTMDTRLKIFQKPHMSLSFTNRDFQDFLQKRAPNEDEHPPILTQTPSPAALLASKFMQSFLTSTVHDAWALEHDTDPLSETDGFVGIQQASRSDQGVAWAPAKLVKTGQGKWAAHFKFPKNYKTYLTRLPFEKSLDVDFIYKTSVEKPAIFLGSSQVNADFSFPSPHVFVEQGPDPLHNKTYHVQLMWENLGMGKTATEQENYELLLVPLIEDTLHMTDTTVSLHKNALGQWTSSFTLQWDPLFSGKIGALHKPFAGSIGGILRQNDGTVLGKWPLVSFEGAEPVLENTILGVYHEHDRLGSAEGF